MALEGTLKDFGLPDIFQLIGLQRKTGILTMKRDQDQVTVVFDEGMVVGADSSGKRLEDKLGHVLVKQGKLTPSKLEECLQTQKQTLQRLGHILVASGAISQEDLKQAISLQVSQVVFRLFRWKEGEYHFGPTESVDYDKNNVNAMSADFILMEGIRMVDEWPIIEKKIPSMDLVFRSVVDASNIQVGQAEGKSLDDAFSGFGGADDSAPPTPAPSTGITLSAEEERVFRKIDGTSTVQQVVDASGMDEFNVCRVMFDLLNRNIIAEAGRGGGARVTARAAVSDASAAPGYLLLAIALLGAVAGLGMQAVRGHAPFGVVGVGPFIAEPYQLVRDEVTRSRLERLDAALRAWWLLEGEAPEQLAAVAEAGLVDASDLTDVSGRPYEYARTASGYTLSAAGEPGSIERTLAP